MPAVPDGYVHGSGAATEATRLALDRVTDPVAMLLVEGVSDQIAVDTLAAHRRRDLVGERVAVVPIGGAQAIARFRSEYPDVRAVALCDYPERAWFQRVLPTPDVFVCVPDLEGELIGALGARAVAELLADHGDRRPLTTLQRQAAWRTRSLEEQVRRFIGAGARRKLRYARVLVDAAVAADRVPAALEGVLAAVSRPPRGTRRGPAPAPRRGRRSGAGT